MGPTTIKVFVNKKTAGCGTPDTTADTVYDRAVELPTNNGAVARPATSVIAVTVDCPPTKTPLGPAAGARNVTVIPLTGLLSASRTVATNAAEY